MTVNITDVAVAIFEKADGSFLLSSRPEGKPYPHYWEFPGGKIEPGEDVFAALVRELVEELNVTITHATPWFAFIMRYTHATVRLHCWRVQAWHGEMRGMEGQHFEWQTIDALRVSPTLPGCVPIFKALKLPRTYAITNATELGVDAYLIQLDRQLSRGLKLIQVRETTFPPDALARFAKDVVVRAHKYGAMVLVNAEIALANSIGADGVHLNAAQLAYTPARPEFSMVAASTHSRAEIDRAGELGLDFAVLGSVKETLSHPGKTPLGWTQFRAFVDASPLPIFAIGGLHEVDRFDAIENGAHGLAIQRGLNTN
jgi:8-oxo-dGTP diphosphatase